MTDAFNLDLKNLICFFDGVPDGSKGISSSLVALFGEELTLAMLKHYIENEAENIDDEEEEKFKLISTKCTGDPKKVRKKRGQKRANIKWLDAWVKVEEMNKTVFYQTEIKSRSAHSLHGRVLCVNPTDDVAKEHRENRFNDVFGNKDPNVWKVLNKMKDPVCPEYTENPNIEIRPLLCIWNALSDDGTDKSFFKFDAKKSVGNEYNTGDFSYLWVFSISNYARYLLRQKNNDGEIKVELPIARKRIDWINNIIKSDNCTNS